MHLRSLLLAAIASLALAGQSFALDCKPFTTITPDNAAVARSRVDQVGGSNLNGTAYTIATYCPVAAAKGTCTGESLSGRVGSVKVDFTTFDGIVPDIFQHKNGIQVGPIFVPLTGLLPGGC